MLGDPKRKFKKYLWKRQELFPQIFKTNEIAVDGSHADLKSTTKDNIIDFTVTGVQNIPRFLNKFDCFPFAAQ